MLKKVLTTPVRAEDIEDLRIGDVIYLSGTLVTARDDAHMRLVKQGRKLPVGVDQRLVHECLSLLREVRAHERAEFFVT